MKWFANVYFVLELITSLFADVSDSVFSIKQEQKLTDRNIYNILKLKISAVNNSLEKMICIADSVHKIKTFREDIKIMVKKLNNADLISY